MSKPDPIKSKKLAQLVEDRLLDLIRTDNLRPGDAVPSERQLMAQYEVGRPAVREAMQNLQRMGLIDIRHGGRPKVAAPNISRLMDQLGTSMHYVLLHSQSSLDHMKEARIELEAGLARRAAGRRTSADLEDLREILERQQAEMSNSSRFLDLDGEFHSRIASISGNPIFELVSRAIFGWLQEFHVDLVSKPGLETLTMSEHHAILQAIEAADEPGAELAMRTHLSRANALYHQDNLAV